MMKKELKDKWVKALRSNKFKQTRGTLRQYSYSSHRCTYCCLGVLCEVTKIKRFPGGYTADDEDFTQELPYHLLRQFQLSIEQQDNLIELNDNKKKSFEEIADYIEENL